jgi:hypothetical protein
LNSVETNNGFGRHPISNPVSSGFLRRSNRDLPQNDQIRSPNSSLVRAVRKEAQPTAPAGGRSARSRILFRLGFDGLRLGSTASCESCVRGGRYWNRFLFQSTPHYRLCSTLLLEKIETPDPAGRSGRNGSMVLVPRMLLSVVKHLFSIYFSRKETKLSSGK